MGVFGLFKRRGRFNKHKFQPDLWSVDDDNVIVMYFFGNIELKCKYGKDMESLNSRERTFYVAQTLETEVNNGGFLQFFYNSSGCLGPEIVSAFKNIGAHRTANICRKALEIMGDEVPMDLQARREKLEQLGDDAFDACDDAFYEYEEDLTALNCAYIRKNHHSFSM